MNWDRGQFINKVARLRQPLHQTSRHVPEPAPNSVFQLTKPGTWGRAVFHNRKRVELVSATEKAWPPSDPTTCFDSMPTLGTVTRIWTGQKLLHEDVPAATAAGSGSCCSETDAPPAATAVAGSWRHTTTPGLFSAGFHALLCKIV
jgi:hypothetical protein